LPNGNASFAHFVIKITKQHRYSKRKTPHSRKLFHDDENMEISKT